MKCPRSLALAVMLALSLSSCVQITTERGNYPTTPSSAWSLYTRLDIGYALTLPFFWSLFDLDAEIDKAVTTCWPSLAQDAQRGRLADLHRRGVRLFACDMRGRPEQVPIGYAVRGQAPAEGLDAYLDAANAHQAPGRTLVEKRHASTNAGDMVIQRIRERLVSNTGSVIETTQYQFFIVKFGALHFLFIEASTAEEPTIDSDADLIGKSFTPTR